MTNHINNNSSPYNFEKIVDIIIKLLVLFMLFGWCIDILHPFILILIWGAIIAIAIYPLQNAMAKLFGGRQTLAAIILTILMVGILLVPGIIVSASLYDGIGKIKELYNAGMHPETVLQTGLLSQSQLPISGSWLPIIWRRHF
jgi:predicted PurR-regulated permease PerM